MSGILCPKCGSNQVLNDQCLKCGIIVSKFRANAPAAGSPVSFVANTAEPRKPQEYSYTLPESVIAHEAVRKKTKLHTRLIGLSIIAILVIGGYTTYSLLRQRAARTVGDYKNLKVHYSIKFPQPKSEWFHYADGEADLAILKDAQDAFYRDRAGRPSVAFGVGGIPEWLEDGVNGACVAGAPDARRVASAIAGCLRDPVRLSGMRRNARAAARRFLLPDHVSSVASALRDAARNVA